VAHTDPQGPVTLHDVARAAGVAVSTVSRALSNPDRVSARTREHVRAVAEQLDYRPNRIAQALPSGSMSVRGWLGSWAKRRAVPYVAMAAS